MSNFILHKIRRIVQGMIGILLLIIVHMFITNNIQSGYIVNMIITLIMIATSIIVIITIQSEIMQLLALSRVKEEVIDVRENYMFYNWEAFKSIPDNGTYFIKYITYKDEKIIVKIGMERT